MRLYGKVIKILRGNLQLSGLVLILDNFVYVGEQRQDSSQT
jgi:hypothetical protein